MLSKLLYGGGIIAVVTAIIQWYIKFPDISQLVFGLHLALTIIMCAYLHSWMVHNVKEIKELNRALDKAIDYMRDIEQKVTPLK